MNRARRAPRSPGAHAAEPVSSTPGHVLVAELADPGARLNLSPEESRYVAQVCRVRIGQPLTLTDGRGGLAFARVASIGRQVVVELERQERLGRLHECRVLCGAPEGHRADWLVEKLAELGAATFEPLECERGRWHASQLRPERWGRLCAAALRQSRGRWRMEIRPVRPLAEVLEDRDEAERWVADPDGQPAGGVSPSKVGLVMGMIGPAAGFATRERAALQRRGFQPIRLAETRLRTETAAAAWTAWWAAGTVGAESSREGSLGPQGRGSLDDSTPGA
jgi:16S rRNA (uracil1498-N3)-methyltransferase